MIEGRIKANLGPLNEQIYTLTHPLNHLVQESSADNSPTADTFTQQKQQKQLLHAHPMMNGKLQSDAPISPQIHRSILSSRSL